MDLMPRRLLIREELGDGRLPQGLGIQMHVACFYVWDSERTVFGHEPSGPGGVSAPETAED